MIAVHTKKDPHRNIKKTNSQFMVLTAHFLKILFKNP